MQSSRFRSLLATPLFLHLSLIVYKNATEIKLSAGRELKEDLLEEYIHHCQVRVGTTQDGPLRMSWLAGTAQAMRHRRQTSFYPDRAPVEYFPVSLERQMRRTTVVLCLLLVIVPSLVVRLTMVSLAEKNETQTIYIYITFLMPLTVGLLAWVLTRDELKLTPVSRTTSVRRNLRKFAKQASVLFIAHGVIAFLVMPFAVHDVVATIILIGFPVSMMLPAIRMMRSSEPAERGRMPYFPGEEISAVFRAALIVGCLVGAGFYCSVTLSMSALYPALQNAVIFHPIVNTLFYAIPVGLCVFLGSGGADVIRRRVCMALLARHEMLPRNYFKTLENFRRSSILVPRMGAFEFRHVMIRDHVAKKDPGHFMLTRSIELEEL